MIHDERMLSRFWAKVDKSDGCWMWTAAKKQYGYGVFNAGGKFVLAHRFAYELLVGEIPNGLMCCHHCDTPSCVNPAHIFLGTNKDNAADRDKKNRLILPVESQFKCKPSCKYGHEYTPENTYIHTGRQGKPFRGCLICQRRNIALAAAKKKAATKLAKEAKRLEREVMLEAALATKKENKRLTKEARVAAKKEASREYRLTAKLSRAEGLTALPLNYSGQYYQNLKARAASGDARALASIELNRQRSKIRWRQNRAASALLPG